VSTFVLVFVSCKKEKDVLIADFEEFVIKTSNEYNSCNDVVWEQINREFQKLDNRYSQLEDKLSEQEKERIDVLRGRFYSIRVKYETKQLKDKVKSGYDTTKGFIDEFFSNP
jgi:predicted  nucleic acid-binding Zn-ribbon protein